MKRMGFYYGLQFCNAEWGGVVYRLNALRDSATVTSPCIQGYSATVNSLVKNTKEVLSMATNPLPR